MTYNNFAVFADRTVGLKIIRFFNNNYPEYLKAVIVIDENSDVYNYLLDNRFDKNNIILNNDLYSETTISKLKGLNLDYIVLSWWPHIIRKEIFSLPKIGTINFHPSYLPFNKGKHYNFWTLVEDTPFGVTIHFVDESIDGGDIIFQEKIQKSWEDNGETLYLKAQDAMADLFIENLPKLIKGDYKRIKQSVNQGTFHYAKEIVEASRIDLNKDYKARDLLNLIRARTFKGYPACYFYDKNKKYEVRIEIKEVK
jgi:methionyl-tRNA formyltransferase